jgi:hypothetical protein
VKDELVWVKDANGKTISPAVVPNAGATAYFITANANLKVGSKYIIDPNGTPSVLVYQIKNGKAVEGTEQTFQDKNYKFGKGSVSLKCDLVVDANGKTSDFAGFAPGAGTYAVTLSVPLLDQNGGAAIGQITGQVTIPGGQCPCPCPRDEPETAMTEPRPAIRPSERD